jgi:glycosyltransferase involved in cell wall biosynthesis
LADAGYQVSLIARTPSPQSINGVRIIPSIGSSRYRLLRFLLLPAVGVQALLQNAEIYHLHNPDTLPLVILLRIFGKKVIYDTHEDFSRKILVKSWIPKLLRRPLAFLVGKSESLVSNIATASIATQQDVVERLKNDALLLGNPPRVNEELYARVSRLAQGIDSQECRVRAIYIGHISRSRGLYEMVDALAIANKTTHVRLWLIGPADKEDLDSASNRPGWKYVDYMPSMAQESAFAYVERADVGLVVVRNVGGYASTDPNKLYEYMMFGKPFIASAFDAWKDKLADIDAGWFVEPGSANEIADVLLEISENGQIATNKGARGKKFTRSYNWETESQKLLELYSGL